MNKISVNQDELLAFAKKIYEEACYGYMDLKESACEVLVREFIDGKQIVSPTDTNISTQSIGTDRSGYMSHGSVMAVGTSTFTATINTNVPNTRLLASGSLDSNGNNVSNRLLPSGSLDSNGIYVYDGDGVNINIENVTENYDLAEAIFRERALESSVPQVRSEELVRSEEYVRELYPEQNFYGNDSERI